MSDSNAWSSLFYSVNPQVSTIETSRIEYRPLTLPTRVEETVQDGKRWYLCEGVLYPSITSLLSATDREGAKALQSWKRAIGQDAATRITSAAAQRGVQWHSFCEQFVMGQSPHWSLMTQPLDVSYGATVASVLNGHIARVLASEARVASTAYGVAGRMDVAVELCDGRKAIVDFKTGKKQKSGNRLDNYAMQATFYADALTEQIPSCIIDTIVIVQLLPRQIVWQESRPTLWRDALRSRITDFAVLVNEQLG